MDEPLQILTADPALMEGNEFTVTGFIAVATPQEFMTRYIIVSTPGVTPVTTSPDTEALPLLVSHELYRIPDAPLTLRVIGDDTHTEPAPLILPASGNGLMVTENEVIAVPQTLVYEYSIVSTPALTPVTNKLPEIAAFSLVADQVPPGVTSVKLTREPAHTSGIPVIVPA